MNQSKQPCGFIEVWKDPKLVHQVCVHDINAIRMDCLNKYLKVTQKAQLETVAIWKIYLKPTP